MTRFYRKRILYGSTIFILIITSHYVGVLSPLERLWQNTIASISAPISEKIGNIIFWAGWKNKNELQSEIDVLRDQLQNSQSTLANLNKLEKENNELKIAIHWRDIQKQNYSIGKIVGRPFNLPDTFAIINRGKQDGVVKGLPVIINDNFLIGKIVDVEDEVSIVRLITDNKSVFSVRRPNETEPIGKVTGRLGLSLLLDSVPSTEELIENSPIVTSGLDPNIPGGLIIGVVDTIQKEPNDFFQSATLRIPYSFRDISILSIIIP